MTTTRSYRGARTTEDALDELIRCAGTQFDPRMVTAMVAAIEEHGWQVEDVPLFAAVEDAVAAELLDPALRPFDHDDPTEFVTPRSGS
jgi:hypothetical protein